MTSLPSDWASIGQPIPDLKPRLFEAVQSGAIEIDNALKTRLMDLRSRATAKLGTDQPRLRCVHHLACSGGTLISQCISAQPNTWLLSEVDPLSPIAHKHPFVPTDMIGLVRLGSRPTSDDTALALFKAALGVLTEEARLTGTALILRDHAHSHFTHGPGVPDRLTLQEIVQESHEVLGLVSVRHPLDSYLSLQKNKWVHFTPGTLTEYCRRSLIFLDRHQTTPILRYEDFVTQPDDHMAWVCAQLDLPYSPDYARLFATIKLSGSSGRVSHTIGPLRPRRPVNDAVAAELHNSTCYETLCDRLGYDPDPASPALRPEGVRGQG